MAKTASKAASRAASFEELFFLVSKLSRSALELSSLTEFWPVLAEALVSQFKCDRATLYFVEQERLTSQFAVGLDRPLSVRRGQGLAGYVAEHGRTYLANDAAKDPRFDPSFDRATGYKTASVLAAAFDHEGRVVGVVELFNKPGGFDKEDVRELEWLAPHIGFLLQRMHLSDEKLRLEAKAAQGAKLAELGYILSGVMHDLGQPVNVLLAYAQLLQKNLPKGSPHRADVDKIVDGAEAVQTIARNLLEFARGSEFELLPTDLGTLLRETLDLVDHQAKMQKVSLKAAVGAELPRARGSANHLRQVLLNLVVNSLHAMPDGGILVIEAAPAGDKVEVKVRDSGAGIPADVLPRIFERFFTTRKEGGTGLGLAFARDIVRKCGGDITAASAGPGKGAVFTVSLPAAEPKK